MISGIQVEEGFLDQLQIRFAPGLNVIVGARGTGKTSVIELIRYCLNLPVLTPDARIRGSQQAISVLAGGRVTVELESDGERLFLTREGDEPKGRPRRGIDNVTILAQNEVEAIAALPSGRRELLDRFVQGLDELESQEQALTARLRSATEEICAGLNQLDAINDSSSALSTIPEQLQSAKARQDNVLKDVAATRADQQSLSDLQRSAAEFASRASQLGATVNSLERLESNLASARRTVDGIEDADGPASSPTAMEIRRTIRKIEELLAATQRELQRATSLASAELEENSRRRVSLEQQGRSIRIRLEELQQGAGQLTRQVLMLEEQNAQYDELKGRLRKQGERISRLTKSRERLYLDLDEVRSRRHKLRRAAASELTARLRPLIKVSVTRSSATQNYRTAIIDAMKGSGIHYNQLAPILARSMSPLELASAAEQGDIRKIVRATGIGFERATAVASVLRSHGTADVVASEVDDGVALYLLDGTEYKSTRELSIGQRCTVVIPLMLSARNHVLILDQPEDHLDNAFVANALVPALRAREANDQYIIATHNANIPVLGNADQVIILGSDGRRAHIVHAGPLTDPQIVAGISSLMEGGKQAFRRRARFYASSDNSE